MIAFTADGSTQWKVHESSKQKRIVAKLITPDVLPKLESIFCYKMNFSKDYAFIYLSYDT